MRPSQNESVQNIPHPSEVRWRETTQDKGSSQRGHDGSTRASTALHEDGCPFPSPHEGSLGERTVDGSFDPDLSKRRLLASLCATRQDRGTEEQGNPIGLTVLHEPENVPIADLVFIHGPGGDSIKSWTSEEQDNVLWPRDWLSEESLLKSTRVTTYGYTSHISTASPDRLLQMTDLARDLLATLHFNHDREGRPLNIGCVPLVFVAHSLGGLIAKQAYLLAVSGADPTCGGIAQAVAAFVFFSTPHRNLQSSVVNDILRACVAGWQPLQHTDLVETQLSKLQDINDRFRDLAIPPDMYSFYEQPSIGSVNSRSSLILPSNVVTLNHPSETSVPLDAEHTTISRVPVRAHPNGSSVRTALTGLVEKFKSGGKSIVVDGAAGQIEDVTRFLCGCVAPEDDLAFFSEKRSEGSCEWILLHPTMDEFLTDDAPYCQILWCHGSPGSGKSVSATYIIEYLLEDSKACAYYYFRSGRHVKNRLSQFLLSIASQISQHVPEYRRKLRSLARARFDVEKTSHKLLWKTLFVQALFECQLRATLYIIIDGLDELPQAEELVQKMLVELADVSFPMRLLVVSRPTVDIETAIEHLSKRISLQRMALKCNVEDLNAYVRDELNDMIGNGDFKEQKIKEIIAKADGNFLWAHLVVREVLKCQTEVQVKGALREVPRELEPLYAQMDARLADNFHSRPQDREMGHTVIEWTACAVRSLHLEEVKIALEDGFPHVPDMRQTVQRLCGDFVVIDKKGYVSVMHASARESLMSNNGLNYYVDPLEANQKLFSRCLQALTPVRSSFDDSDDHICAFLDYCASSWPLHLARSTNYRSQDSLSTIKKFLGGRAALDWISMLARAGKLRVMAEASRALNQLLNMVKRSDRDRSLSRHQTENMEVLSLWAQDLIRVMGRFGQQIKQHPTAVYNLMLAFCPQDTMLHKQFGSGDSISSKEDVSLFVQGKMSPTWDHCFTKFAVTNDALPHSVLTLDRYFAVLTKSNGTVYLYRSATCEAAHRLQHGEHVLTFCADATGTRIATYGLRKTIVWDIESGELLCSIENPKLTKALTISFQRTHGGNEFLITFSDDCHVRACSLESARFKWDSYGVALDSSSTPGQPQAQFPHTARFSPDGRHLAISYRGAHPIVWSTAIARPQYIACCNHRARQTSKTLGPHSRDAYAQSFAWNPITGHLLGTYNDLLVFKWHPQEDDFALSELMGDSIKCSTDGRFFVTGNYDGKLRVWDFERFVPIYDMSHPDRIQDVDLGRNEARVYDIRDQHCNIWEPDSLLQAMESDDTVVASDDPSSMDNGLPSHISGAVQEGFEPITALVAMHRDPMYVTGDDAGVIKVSNYEGVIRAEIRDISMTIDKLAWSDESHLLASFDLRHEVQIHEIAPETAKPQKLRSFTEVKVSQLLFNTLGDKLLMTSPNVVKVYRVRSADLPTAWSAAKMGKWIVHPQDGDFALGFTSNEVILMPWASPVDIKTFSYDLIAGQTEATSMQQKSFHPRRPSDGHPAGSPDLDPPVHKVFTSPNATLVVLDIYSTIMQIRRRTDCLLIITDHLVPNTTNNSVPVRSMSPHVMNSMYVSLGFIDCDRLMRPNRTVALREHTHWISQRWRDSNTFVFVDKDFWVCSVDIGTTLELSTKIRRHFFLPREWQNAEWLDMAVLTISGDLLCPKNGDVAVVSNGFLNEFKED